MLQTTEKERQDNKEAKQQAISEVEEANTHIKYQTQLNEKLDQKRKDKIAKRGAIEGKKKRI